MANGDRIPRKPAGGRFIPGTGAPAAGKQSARHPAISLLEREPAFRRLASNLAACLSLPPRAMPRWAWRYSPMFRSAFLRRSNPWRGMLWSALLHVMAFTAILSEPASRLGPLARRASAPENFSPQREVLYYSPSDLLPLIAPPKPASPRRQSPANAASPPVRLAFHRAQEIVSQPPAPDNRRQTILQPDLPRLEPEAEVRIPNLIRWSFPKLPAPPVPVSIRKPVAAPQPEVARPQPAARELPELPSVAAVTTQAAALPVPLPRIESPRLPVPVRIVRPAPGAPAAPAAAEPGAAPVPAIPNAAIEAGSPPPSLPSLVAVSVAPAPPADDLALPSGSRSGKFAAAPEGTGEESSGATASEGTREGNGSGEESLAGDERAVIRVPGLSVRGGSALPAPSGIGETGGGSDLRRLMASLARPTVRVGSMSEARKPAVESEFFGRRRVYTVYMNMPNLTSASGSWVLRFAEPEGPGPAQDSETELTTPVAIRKVDPMYVASAMREGVEGIVTLAALVLKDGTLANIRVVGSLDPRLDSSAVAALTQWRFRPARKNGAAIDLEVLIQIPFRIASL